MDESCNELQCILDDDTHYRKCYDIFLSREEFTDVSREDWYIDLINKLMPSLKESVDLSSAHEAGEGAEEKTLRCLGVGSGCGKTETLFLSRLIPHFPSIYQRVMEPNERQIGIYKKRVSSQGDDFNRVMFDYRLETVEDYCTSTDNTPSTDVKFHFISVVHSAYHFPDMNEYLGYLYGKLERNGLLAVEMVSADSPVPKVIRMMPKMGGIYPESSSIGAARNYFNQQKISYDSYKLDVGSDMSGCFDDDVSDDCNLLLDFHTRVQGFSKSSAVLDNTRKNVLETMRSAIVRQPDGREFMDVSSVMIVARR